MNKYFVLNYIVEALKPLYPVVELGKRDYSKEAVREFVPVDFECKNCASCPYHKWEVESYKSQYFGR